MAMKIDMKDMSHRQREAWRMRYWYGWRITRIALELGISHVAVTKLIRRAERRVGLRRTVRVRIIRTKPRRVRGVSLSDVQNI
jgi:DNA-directed RNA polymerase specialized sigma24 family protein